MILPKDRYSLMASIFAMETGKIGRVLSAILFQDFPIYNLTIRESIGVGRISRHHRRNSWNVRLKYSGADEFINDDYEQLIWKEFKDGIKHLKETAL